MGQVTGSSISWHSANHQQHHKLARIIISNQEFGPLRFHQDGTFHISILEDLHFGENAWEPWGPRQDQASIKVIETVLDAEPATSLVVLNGDLITGQNVLRENGTHYVDQIVSPIIQRNLTWASTYGNHDSDLNLSRWDLYSREKRYPNSRTEVMISSFIDEAGITNYFLPVYPSSGPTDTPLLILYFFDSRGGFDYVFQSHKALQNWVHPRVVKWFKQTSSKFPDIPSLAFVHIPPNATLVLQEEGVNPHHQPGINQDVPLSQQGQGWCLDGTEGCDYGGQDLEFMQVLIDTPGLMALFFGHDHGNSWCKKWDNRVNLCFGQRTGYGGYGQWVRGGRQVLVTIDGLKEREVDTWIRLETGEAVGQVSLNRTYGEDRYKKVKDDRTCLDCHQP
ncbi:putative calcineurin-like phosphoesterase [Podospora fimiseda]|uniref:Calcineurin-like phosphoesterase n=1 Tax=Podospora fimiseda TaxID=252190 RepID=A0AAN7BM79_9PEZI|nr:putative calcineurin-like phosphoesterase [Podospora fimiseda]